MDPPFPRELTSSVGNRVPVENPIAAKRSPLIRHINPLEPLRHHAAQADDGASERIELRFYAPRAI